jgi:hypothetical protein
MIIIMMNLPRNNTLPSTIKVTMKEEEVDMEAEEVPEVGMTITIEVAEVVEVATVMR